MKSKIIVLGAGESGTGAALLAREKGHKVFVSDIGKIKEHYKALLIKNNIEWEEENHNVQKILDANEIIKSPGIPNNTTIIKKIKEKKIPLISDIEFAGRYTTATKICVTGSNGKTTTASLIYHLLKNAGFKVALVGNIGKSFALQIVENNYEYYVIELSSFQLDDMYEFVPDIAVLLNITRDHLDRYDNKMDNYIKSKFRITKNLGRKSSLIYCADDENIKKELTNRKELKTNLFPFSLDQFVEKGAYINTKEIIIKLGLNTFNMNTNKLLIQGKHNFYNTMASGIVGKILNIKNEIIRESFQNFTSIRHRMEKVLKIKGIEFINDSKATNINATWYALESIHNPTIWIVGGIDKGNDYKILQTIVKNRVKAIICLGKDNKKIIKAFKNDVEIIEETQSMAHAVKQAYNIGEKGDTVVLSPACASFDLFENYEDRGYQFIQAVKYL